MSLDLNSMQIQNPARYQRFVYLESFTTNYINNQSGASYRLADPNGIIIIPVVVHVLNRNETEGTGLNISLAQIQSQIDVLNEDFRRLNANRTNTPAAFAGVASDYNFEFRLACQDPNGNTTNGVTRRSTNKTGFTFSTIVNPNNPNERITDETSIGIKITNQGGQDPWPTDRYLNIWVGNFTDGTLGYATWPADFLTNPNVDGVVISTTSMGRTGNVTAPYDGGRTATHEVGHWLNLRHIWGDSTCGDDFVADTPVQQNSNFGCPTFPLVAVNTAQRWFGPRCNVADPSSMFMNYMDYTDDNCMNVFTNGQRLRGRAIFAAGGPRAAFLNNYFMIQQPTSNIICTGVVNLTNPNCLAPTWTIVAGPATINSIGNNQVAIQAAGSGTVILRAIAGNYASEINLNVTPTPIVNSSYVTINDIDACEHWMVLRAVVDPASNNGVTRYYWTENDPTGTSQSIGEGLTYLADIYVPPLVGITRIVYAFGRNDCSPPILLGSKEYEYRDWDTCTSPPPYGCGAFVCLTSFPNPTSNELTISFKGNGENIKENKTKKIKQTGTAQVRIFDENQKSWISLSAKDNEDLKIPVSQLPKGTYYLDVSHSKGDHFRKRILIE
jgi:hypothetical protein